MNEKFVVCFVMTLFIATATFSAFGSITNESVTSNFGEVLDQSQTWSDDCKYVGGSEWQEFVPAIDNLNRVEVKVAQWYGGSPDLEVTIEKPLGNVLTSRKLPASSIPSGTCNWVSFNVPDITLTPGSSYYIRVIAPLGSEYGWGIAYNNLYSPGISSQDPADWCFKTYGYYSLTIPGLTFSYMYFMLPEVSSSAPSGWGHLEVDIEELTSYFQMNEGYLNVYSDNGWVIANMYINEVEGMEELSTYFQLGGIRGEPETMTSFSAHVDFDDSPEEQFGDGERANFDVGTELFNADGAGFEHRADLSEPPLVYEYIPFDISWDFTKEVRDGENVQCADMQCVPMSTANSLQYLENSYVSITIPDAHVAGEDGDGSLVGELDSTMGRTVNSRTDGGGCNVPMFFEGKFEYLNANGLKDKLVHRHQGTGFGAPGADYTAHGITSKDESVGGKVTFDWIREQLEKCEDVEAWIAWGGGGGHAVRIYGCGETNGKPYLRFLHDRIQAYDGPGGSVLGDDVGLEWGQVYVEDLDSPPDGMMNWGAPGDNIVFAASESPKRLEIVDIYTGLGIYVDLVNHGEYEEYVEWSIEVEASWMFFGGSAEGTDIVPPGEELTIKTGFLLGFGPATVTVTINDEKHTYDCFLLGPYAFGL